MRAVSKCGCVLIQKICAKQNQVSIWEHSTILFHIPWSRVLLEKLNNFQLVKKFPVFCGTQKFITAFASARHLSLSRADQSMPPPSHFLKVHFNIILPSTPRSSKLSLSLGFPHQHPICTSPLPHTIYMPLPSHSSSFDHPNNIWWEIQIIKLLIM